jgi:hypothetical protein
VAVILVLNHVAALLKGIPELVTVISMVAISSCILDLFLFLHSFVQALLKLLNPFILSFVPLSLPPLFNEPVI